MSIMKILLVYPFTPDTFWSFKHVLRFVSWFPLCHLPLPLHAVE